MGENIDEAKGRAKEAAGDLTDDEGLKREGKVDKAVSDVKEKVDDVADKVKERPGGDKDTGPRLAGGSGKRRGSRPGQRPGPACAALTLLLDVARLLRYWVATAVASSRSMSTRALSSCMTSSVRPSWTSSIVSW